MKELNLLDRRWTYRAEGDYRIVYVVDDEARVVTIGTVGHRREVCRRLDL